MSETKKISGRRGFLRAGVAATAAAAAATFTGEKMAFSLEDKEGTLLRGPDGKLYFLPDDALAPFVVSEKSKGVLEAEFGDHLKANTRQLEGKGVHDAGVNAKAMASPLFVNLGVLRGVNGAVTAKAIKGS